MSNTVCVLNEHEIVEPKLKNLDILTNGHDKNETQSDMVEEYIQVEANEIVLNDSPSQLVTSAEINPVKESNQKVLIA